MDSEEMQAWWDSVGRSKAEPPQWPVIPDRQQCCVNAYISQGEQHAPYCANGESVRNGG